MEKTSYNDIAERIQTGVNQFLTAFGDEYDKIQTSFAAYFNKEGIVKPSDTDEFLMWLCVKFPQEPLYKMIDEAKKPHNYRLFHEYRVRCFEKPEWDLDHELIFLQNETVLKEEAPSDHIGATPQINSDSIPFGKSYEIEPALMRKIFDFCQNGLEKPIFKIDEGEFSERFRKAYFLGDIYTRGNKTKLRTLVYLVGTSGIIKGGDWYTYAAKNLDLPKSRLSGFYANQDIEWGLKGILEAWENNKDKFLEAERNFKIEANNKIRQANPPKTQNKSIHQKTKTGQSMRTKKR